MSNKLIKIIPTKKTIKTNAKTNGFIKSCFNNIKLITKEYIATIPTIFMYGVIIRDLYLSLIHI